MTDHFPGVNDAAEPEDEAAEVKQRLARLEREHARLIEKFFELPTPAKVASLEQDFELTMKAVDARLHELAEADPVFAKAAAKAVMDAVADIIRRMFGSLERQTVALQATADTMTTLDARIAAIERLVGPALAGRVKLLAQEVAIYRGFRPSDPA